MIEAEFKFLTSIARLIPGGEAANIDVETKASNSKDLITLHQAMTLVLYGNGEMTTEDVVIEINKKGTYKRKDREQVSGSQIGWRGRKYGKLFEVVSRDKIEYIKLR